MPVAPAVYNNELIHFFSFLRWVEQSLYTYSIQVPRLGRKKIILRRVRPTAFYRLISTVAISNQTTSVAIPYIPYLFHFPSPTSNQLKVFFFSFSNRQKMEFFFICLCVSTKDSVRPQLFLFSSAVNAKESCSCFFPTGPKEEMQHIYNSGSVYNTIVCKHGLTCPSSYSFAHVF